MTVTLLYFLLCLSILLTIVLGLGVGVTTLSDWTQAPKYC
jgi:hypothetical protein